MPHWRSSRCCRCGRQPIDRDQGEDGPLALVERPDRLVACGEAVDLKRHESRVGGLDRTNTLDDAGSEAFSSINGEAGSDDFWVWLPCLMITGQANRQSFESSLAGSHHSVGPCDMPDHQKLTTGMKHTVHLVDCCC